VVVAKKEKNVEANCIFPPLHKKQIIERVFPMFFAQFAGLWSMCEIIDITHGGDKFMTWWR
jgi:hypothetical protein